MRFWFPGAPGWVWITAVLLLLAAGNLGKVKVFGEAEFWFSIIKISAIVAMIVGGAALLVFGVQLDPAQPSTAANLWDQGGFFPNGLAGLLACLTVVMIALGGGGTGGVHRR
ncbi:proline-specific permease ProY, partial [Rothia kristinae]